MAAAPDCSGSTQPWPYRFRSVPSQQRPLVELLHWKVVRVAAEATEKRRASGSVMVERCMVLDF